MSDISDKLDQILQNVPKVYHGGQTYIVSNAECLKGFNSDTAMLLDDISPVTHDMGVRVRGKNLFDVNNQNWSVGLISAINGTLNASNTNYKTTDFLSILEPNKAYTVGFNQTFEISASTSNRLCFYDENKNFIESSYNGNYTEVKRYSYQLNVPANAVYTRYSVRITDTDIQIELGTTATAYTPYVPDLTAVKVRKQGKNLIPFPYRDLKLGTSTYNGVDFTVYEDGSILINGTATSNTTRYLYNNTTDLLGLKSGITISGNKNASDNTQQANVYFVCNYYDSAAKMQMGIQMSTNASGKKTITDNWKGLGIYLHIPSGKTLNNLLIKPQIVIGDTADNYEHYITPTEYIPNTDGTVNGVTSLYPNTALITDTDGVIIDCDYYKDIDKTFDALTTSVALSGGE